MNEMNITPLVDVAFVLLIIFMITAPMMVSGVSVDLPEAQAKQLPVKDEPISVSISSSGEVYIQDKKIDPENLPHLLDRVTKQSKDARIFIRGDTNINYGRIMQIVGIINHAGYTKIALVTSTPTHN